MKTAKLSIVNECREQLLYSSLSKALSSASNSKELHKVHSLIITSGLERRYVFFCGNLISKYAQFKDPISSLSIFNQFSPKNNVYQWNSVIRALTHNGLFSKALDLYFKMKDFNVKPDTYTFPSVINACAALGDFEIGNVVQNHVLEIGFGFDLYIGNALVDMYARFGDLVKARNVFEEMTQRDIVSWNSLISGYSANGYWEEALEIYYELRIAGLKPDNFTLSSVLPACGGLLAVKEGEVIHGLVEKLGMNIDVIMSNGLLSMYFKFGRLMDAQRVFNKMVVKDYVSWNTLICGYCQMELFEESIQLFREMVKRFRPDLLTITSVLRACGLLRDLEFGKFVHDYILRSGIEFDVTASNIVIDTYAKCGDLLASRKAFDRMKCRDSVSWNTLINGYIQSRSYGEGVKLFKKMKMDLKPDSITFVTLLSISTRLADTELGKEIHCDLAKLGFDSDLVVSNALVDMYSKCGNVKDSLKVFENMKVRDIVTWNTIIAACVQAEDCTLAFRMISQMRNEELIPDMGTLLGILPICSLIAAKRQGKEVHACTFKFGFESTVPVGNALIEMYSKCGNLKYCIRVFEDMKTKDVVTWTALVSAYGMYGEGKKALRAFAEMEEAGIIPDHIAFVAIIYACSHSGLVEEGLACFDHMKVYSIEPRIEHYACLVDLLSRSGQLSKAEEFISSMPLKPDASIWGSLLSACRASGNLKIAERVSEHILRLHSDDPGYYILVSNVYAALGRWDEVRKIRKCLRDRGLKKDPGCSWIEIKNSVHAFGAGEKFFIQYEEVNKYLGQLADLITKEGYTVDLNFALHDVEEDEKRSLLCGHSERLAIAFGLLNTKPGTPLQVFKNLRVCGDCHTWTKYITKIVKRDILVRDANRFHMFHDGACSCEDHW
ncbi:pentatricopeptide repeat-containing protein At3g03580 [Ricinus communis]|uniref:pentatricopeptide repeat-containing protein At3g03580 n=1 Tax=Ricinus communis TaxID=3988 RepID=UPI00201B0679|nr:pentatricopeptide repeat-containing protein At3g03580 [Ricinus communis]